MAVAVATAELYVLAEQSPGTCFAGGTLVRTVNGLIAIEEIAVGDSVWAFNPETGESAWKRVVQLFRNETEEWLHLTVGGEEIVCTPEHPFYSPIKGWTAACDLRAGDILVTVNGEYVILEQVQHELLERPKVTYNFEVEDYHTYYVGSTEVLVHNTCQIGKAKNSKEFDSRSDAFRSAKRDAGIPVTEQPSSVKPSIWHETGPIVPGRTYAFKNGVTIIEHAAGHIQYGLGPHFNIIIDGTKWPYFYP